MRRMGNTCALYQYLIIFYHKNERFAIGFQKKTYVFFDFFSKLSVQSAENRDHLPFFDLKESRYGLYRSYRLRSRGHL